MVKFYTGATNVKGQRATCRFEWSFPSTLSTLRDLSNSIILKIGAHHLDGGEEFAAVPEVGTDLNILMSRSTAPMNRSTSDSYLVSSFSLARNQPPQWVKISVYDFSRYLRKTPSPAKKSKAPRFSLDADSISFEAVKELAAAGLKGGNLQTVTQIQAGLARVSALSNRASSSSSSGPSTALLRKELDSVFSSFSEFLSVHSSKDGLLENEVALSQFRISVLQAFQNFLDIVVCPPSARKKHPRPTDDESEPPEI